MFRDGFSLSVRKFCKCIVCFSLRFHNLGLKFSSPRLMISDMSETKNPYSTKNINHDYGSYYNIFYSFFQKTGSYPMVYELNSVLLDAGKMESAGFSRVFTHDFENLKSEVNNMETCYERGSVMIQFCRKESVMDRIERMERSRDEEEEGDSPRAEKSAQSCRILYLDRSDLDSIQSLIERTPFGSRKSGKIYLLCSMDGMLELQKFKTRLPDRPVDLAMNYGQVAASKFEKIVSLMDSGKNGLVLLSGHPGTGKSTFIKMLSMRTGRKVIYLSSSSAEHLTNPEFLSFMMRHRDSILLLEDAEKVLRSRDEQDNSAISNLLNVTDGILGDCLNIMVIATFNIDREKIDSALVRKGRLLVEHHFEPLPAEMANALLVSIGSDRVVTEPTSLADIYNPDENFHEEEEQRKVGF